MNIAADKGASSFALNPMDDLNDLRMSEKAMPLLNKVKDFIRDVVEPMSEEFHRLGEGNRDIWSYAPGQLEVLEAASGQSILRPAADPALPSAPGQLASHYAPSARVRLDAYDVAPGEALLAFGPTIPATSGLVVNLSATGDLIEAAQRLFGALRALDASGARTIAVMPIPGHGLGEAINDRLARAAAPRP